MTSRSLTDQSGLPGLISERQALEQAKIALEEHRAHGFRETFEEMVLYDLSSARLTRTVMKLEKSYKSLLLRELEREMEKEDAAEEGKEQEGYKHQHL